MKRILLGILLSLVIVTPTLAAKPVTSSKQLFALGAGNVQVYQYIEDVVTPTTPINPTWNLPNDQQCLWDVDDQGGRAGYGKLEPGTYIGSQCTYSDWKAIRVNGISLRAPTPDLVVTMTFNPSGYSVNALPIWDPIIGNYLYSACVVGPTYQQEYTSLIPDSNNGYAVLGDVTIKIVNSTGRIFRDVQGGLGVRSNTGETTCSSLSPIFIYNHAGFKLGL